MAVRALEIGVGIGRWRLGASVPPDDSAVIEILNHWVVVAEQKGEEGQSHWVTGF